MISCWRHNDETSKYPEIRDWKICDEIMLLIKALEILHEDFSQDCICSQKIWFTSDKGEQS